MGEGELTPGKRRHEEEGSEKAKPSHCDGTFSFTEAEILGNRGLESALVAQLVEQRFCKPKVGGSIPSGGTIPDPQP